jgi:hypothetical protein
VDTILPGLCGFFFGIPWFPPSIAKQTSRKVQNKLLLFGFSEDKLGTNLLPKLNYKISRIFRSEPNLNIMSVKCDPYNCD